VEGAHAVHTDTWVSMGQEQEKQQRRQQFEGFTVDASMMAQADPTAVFMHCLPAYRGIEVAGDVIDGPQSVVFQQAHNRLHAARGALAYVFGVRSADLVHEADLMDEDLP
jgi:ornithine carbamoyltransferase